MRRMMAGGRAAAARRSRPSGQAEANVSKDAGAKPARQGRWRRVLLWSAAIVPLLLLLVLGAVGWIGSERALRPGEQSNPPLLASYAFAAQTETVRFNSLDGTPLVGWFVPAGTVRGPAVALLHGHDGSRAQLLPHAEYLHENGYHVFLFDFRGRGESGGDGKITLGAREPLDVRAAVAWLRARPEVDPERIAVQGVSLGASSGIMAMADEPGIAAIVAESPFSDMSGIISRSFEHYTGLPAFPFAPVTVFVIEQRLDAKAGDIRPIDSITRIGARPALIIEDMNDTSMPERSGIRIYEAAPGPKEYWAVAEAGHADGFDVAPEEYERRVLEFYRTYLVGRAP